MGLDLQEVVDVCEHNLYAKIFMMAQLHFVEDYARIEDAATALKLSELLGQAYTQLGYEVVDIPVASIEERAQLILTHIEA